MPKTTGKHFQIFKNECMKWIDKFGLKGWDVLIEHKEKYDCQAQCDTHLVNRWCVLTLNKTWDDSWEITDLGIKKNAGHEVLELLFARIRAVAQYRYTTKEEIDEAIHEVIRTLENILWVK